MAMLVNEETILQALRQVPTERWPDVLHYLNSLQPGTAAGAETAPPNNPGNPQTPLPPTPPPGLLAIRREIATYRRELPRLLAEGHEGRFVLIQGDQVISLWDTFEDAYQAGVQQFSLGPFLAQPLDARDLTRTFPKELDQAEAI